MGSCPLIILYCWSAGLEIDQYDKKGAKAFK
jgi:hypothetical protein